ncbi:CDP-diacylglycerol--glycerol-3-phosphate 3-phosphatidyltransferase [Limnoglobus roseus]|uniref:CDP-diacylglycerol--glycerol-3-phosphate 3-phosphatidyltransferase n=1 Tax=Limnoglobus roseus TaxID=2598579 RepID=A0A5C1A7L5_9BACT|nr:CDP-diacylglycerol--glycerol-3-phosphate 3-phosphatidyltransferase [Limnoglobus roseus]QEL15289.1 CDP-diacylglycerol--glycerol-3-phosphate 3-phosphatidyltransferase [Limnoglobus roseus]
MPASSLTSVPNLLSLSRVPLGISIFACIAYQQWLAALVLFMIATITDWLDGWWARRFNLVSTVGRSLDPLTDKFLICGTFIYLQAANVGILPWMVTLVVGREILITGVRGMVEAAGKKFGADWFGKLKTSLQCAVILGVLFLQTIRPHESPVLDDVYRVLLYAMLFATLGSGVQYLMKATKLLQ